MPLTSTDCEKGIAKFAWSREGKYIAYLNSDERTTEMKAKDWKKDDAMVYGEAWEYARLRTVKVTTKKMTTRVSGNFHVYDFAWSPDSTSIAYATQSTPESTSANTDGTWIEFIKLETQRVLKLAHFPAPVEDLCWIKPDVWWRATYDLTSVLSSRSVYRLDMASKTWSRHVFGKDNCACTWGLPPGMQRVSENYLVVQVQSGLADQLHTLPEKALLYEDLSEIKSWHAAFRDGETVLAIVRSSASVPNEVYSIFEGETVCLSNHGKEVAELDIATSEPCYATAQDGTGLDGVLIIPKNYDLPKPWPTIVLVHGGPYQRVSCGFDLPFINWSPWFASAGYAVLCVNYRGGSSHGEAYAAGLRRAAGTTDYSDVIDLVKAGIERGIVHQDKVGIAGWSYGGYLAYLAVTRDLTFHFQAAMCGAGIVDWDLMIMTSDDHLFGAQLAGHTPWDVGVENTRNRKGSALWHMQDIKTPILILHGENDADVPVSQARAFHKGCLQRGVACELVVYPRQGHGMFPPWERAHYVDMLERMKRFFDKHLAMVT